METTTPTKDLLADTAYLFRRINDLTAALDRITVAAAAAVTDDRSRLADAIRHAAVTLHTEACDW